MKKERKECFPNCSTLSYSLFLSLRLQDIKTGYANITMPYYFARKLAEQFGNVACNKG